MGERGPQPLSAGQLRTRGSWLAKHRPGEAPAAPPTVPAMAGDFGDEERAAWDHVTAEMVRLGTIQLADAYPLERYCRLLVRWRKLEAFIAANGETLTTTFRSGDAKATAERPEVRIAASLARLLLALEKQLRLDPGSRARIPPAPPALPENELERMLAAREDKARFFSDGT